MPRYIDAEYMFKCETCRHYRENKCNTFCDSGESYSPNMSKIPTADVAEVKHGEWVLMGTEMFMDGSHSSKFCCSLCSREIGVCHEHDSDKYRYAKVMYPYCHCGAKMDGGEQE